MLENENQNVIVSLAQSITQIEFNLSIITEQKYLNKMENSNYNTQANDQNKTRHCCC